MYVARQFALDEAEAMRRAAEIGRGQFVTSGPEGLDATLLPFTTRREADGGWVLEAHMARVNPQWRLPDDSASGEVLVIVSGPDAHVRGTDMPPEPADARFPRVPTWNHLTIHLHGEIVARPDRDFEERHLRELVEKFEPRWRVGTHSDPRLVMAALPALVGVQVRVREIRGKAKLSQNLSSADLEHTIASMRRRGEPQASAVADLMEEISVPWALAREERSRAAARAAGLDPAEHHAAPSGEIYDPETSGF